MNKTQYLGELAYRLRRLPGEERENVLTYYQEYFDEAGEGNEQQAIAELGAPAKVASQILGKYAMKGFDEQSPRRRVRSIWFILLALFSAPITLPLAIAAFAIIVALLAVVLSVLIALAATSFGVTAYGAVAAIAGLLLIFHQFATTVLFVGFGMVCVGAGLALGHATLWISRESLRGVARLSAFLLYRRRKA